MDLKPVYELQERLRATAIAGVNLLHEDFRLKRAAEAIKPLAAASPVFAKLNKQMELLLSQDCDSPAGVLLDTIALADAIICTLAAVEVKQETEELVLDTDSSYETGDKPGCQPVTTAPYSQVKGLVDALTKTGSGNFAFVRDMLSAYPEAFKDYRVKPALIQSLGASYNELAELTSKYLAGCGTEIIPLLKKGFNPAGRKEMVYRANIIGQIAGAAENDFYIEMLETATGDVRTALINNLYYEPSNLDRLFKMAKSERGKNKQCVLNLLGKMENEQVYSFFSQSIKKSPVSVLEALLPVTTDCASRVIAETCLEQLPKIILLIEKQDDAETEKKLSLFCKMVETLVGKHGGSVCECYRQIISNNKILNHSRFKPELNVLGYTQYINGSASSFIYASEYNLTALREKDLPKDPKKLTWETITGRHIAQSLVVCPDKQLQQLAIELYENNKKDTNFLTAAALARILKDSNCTGWFNEQLTNDKTAITGIKRALSYIKWDKKNNGYVTNIYFCNVSCNDIIHKIEIPCADEIKNWMIEQKCMDAILNIWVDTTDSQECEKYGSYFYNRALTMPANADYLLYMLNCKWKKCKGLGTGYARSITNLKMWQLTNYLFHLPGNLEEIHKEIDAVIDMINSGGIKIDMPLGKEGWFNNTLKNPSNYVTLTLDGYKCGEV